MRITLKDITLKNDILNDINNGIIDTDKYVQYIKTNVENANNIISTKLLDLDEEELYELLSKVFCIELDNNDLYRILKEKYGKHYIKEATLNTNIVDEECNRITLIGAATKNVLYDNKTIPVVKLRDIINSYDFVVLRDKKTKLKEKPSNAEKYEYEITNLDEDEEIYEYKIKLLRKDIKDKSVLKIVLALVNKYVKELVDQAKFYSKLEEDETLKTISNQYKTAYESNFEKKKVFIKGNNKRRY